MSYGYRFAAAIWATYTGVFEQSIDCRFHPVDAAAKEARVLLALGRRYAIEVVFDPLGEIGDATEGGFEIVGDNIYK